MLPNSVYITGISSYFHLSCFSMLDILIDENNPSCIAAGSHHTVLVTKDGRVIAKGKSSCFSTGKENFENFAEIKVIDEKIKSVAAGYEYTLYLTDREKVVMAHAKAGGKLIYIPMSKKVRSIYGGSKYCAIIDEKGSLYLPNMKDLYSEPVKYKLKLKAKMVACCNSYCYVVLNDHSVIRKQINSTKFFIVSSLENRKIVKIAGNSDACIALEIHGLVYSCGSNSYGKLGKFQRITCLSSVTDIACYNHSLFLTNDSQLYGCGLNNNGQVLSKIQKNRIFSPVLISQNKKIASIHATPDKSIIIYRKPYVFHDTNIIISPSTKKVIHSTQRNRMNSYLKNIVEPLKNLFSTNQKLKTELNVIKNNMNTMVQINESLEKKNQELKQQQENLVSKIEKLLSLIQELEKKQHECDSTNEALKQENQMLKEHEDSLLSQIEEIEKENQKLVERLHLKDKLNETINENNQNLEQQKSCLLSKIETLEIEKQNEKGLKEMYEQRYQALKTLFDESNREKNEIEKNLKELEKIMGNLEKEKIRLLADCDSKTKQIEKLEQNISELCQWKQSQETIFAQMEQVLY